LKITHGTAIGQRPYQEDRYLVVKQGELTLIGVFDGHSGAEVSEKCYNILAATFLRYINRKPIDLVNTIFSVLDTETKDFKGGSTASLVLITPEVVVTGVLGDSPIQILYKGGEEVVLPEHNVRSNYCEALEVQSRGGVIVNGYLFKTYGDYNKGIQMSRVLGDVELRGVTSQEPEVVLFMRENVTSLLVASDGLTDPAHQTAPFLLTKHTTAEELIEKYKNSFDNVTAVVVQFGGKDESL
jgi:serine/threonine protein phosphatase PrpC